MTGYGIHLVLVIIFYVKERNNLTQKMKISIYKAIINNTACMYLKYSFSIGIGNKIRQL